MTIRGSSALDESLLEGRNLARRTHMASSHVTALQSKHAGLEAQLRQEMARPAPDAAMIQMLKKRKLRIKEELAQA